MHQRELERAKRQEARWRILLILDASRPQGCSETVILRIIGDMGLIDSPRELRKELEYLRDRSLILIDQNAYTWTAELTADGVDVVQYEVEAPAGIDRPDQWA